MTLLRLRSGRLGFRLRLCARRVDLLQQRAVARFSLLPHRVDLLQEHPVTFLRLRPGCLRVSVGLPPGRLDLASQVGQLRLLPVNPLGDGPHASPDVLHLALAKPLELPPPSHDRHDDAGPAGQCAQASRNGDHHVPHRSSSVLE